MERFVTRFVTSLLSPDTLVLLVERLVARIFPAGHPSGWTVEMRDQAGHPIYSTSSEAARTVFRAKLMEHWSNISTLQLSARESVTRNVFTLEFTQDVVKVRTDVSLTCTSADSHLKTDVEKILHTAFPTRDPATYVSPSPTDSGHSGQESISAMVPPCPEPLADSPDEPSLSAALARGRNLLRDVPNLLDIVTKEGKEDFGPFVGAYNHYRDWHRETLVLFQHAGLPTELVDQFRHELSPVQFATFPPGASPPDFLVPIQGLDTGRIRVSRHLSEWARLPGWPTNARQDFMAFLESKDQSFARITRSVLQILQSRPPTPLRPAESRRDATAADKFSIFAAVLAAFFSVAFSLVPRQYAALVGVVWTLSVIVVAYRVYKLRPCISGWFRVHRTWAVVAASVLVLIIVAGWWIRLGNYPPRGITRIAVARFQGPNEDMSLTNRVLSALNEEAVRYPDIEIVPLRKAISEEQGRQGALHAARETGASLVVWGWYDSSAVNGEIYVRCTIRDRSRFLAGVTREEKYTRTVVELDDLAVRQRAAEGTRNFVLMAIGLARYSVQDYPGAVERLTAALKNSGNQADAMTGTETLQLYRGTAYLHLSQPAQAAQDLENALNLGAGGAALHNYGIALQALGRLEEAVKSLRSATATSWNPGAAWTALSDVYSEQGKTDDSLEAAREAVRVSPEDPDANNGLGLALAKSGNFTDAIDAYSDAIDLDPPTAGFWYNRGIAHLNAGDASRARKDLSKAIRRSPDSGHAFAWLGYAKCLQGDVKAALEDFERALTLLPGEPHPLVNRGICRSMNGDWQKAGDDFDAVLAARPSYAEAHVNRAGILFHLGRPEQALQACERAADINPRLATAWTCMGLAFLRGPRRTQILAIERFQKAVEVDPNLYEGWTGLGEACLALGFPHQAVDAFNSAIQADPQKAEGYFGRALANLALGKRDPALRDLEEAIQHSPDDPYWRYHRARLYLESGRSDSAIKDLRVALRHGLPRDQELSAKHVVRCLRDSPAHLCRVYLVRWDRPALSIH